MTAPKKPALKVSSAKDFKKNVKKTLELPSGMVVEVRNPGGLRAFMRNGIIPNSLMPMVQESLDTGKPTPEMDPADVKPEVIEEMMSMMDHIAMTCIVNPEVFPVPAKEADRDDDLLYVDEIADEDKMEVFKWISGGVKELEPFRKE